MSIAIETQWWSRSDLTYEQGRLVFCGQFVDEIAAQYSVPTFLYSGNRVRQNVDRIAQSLDDAGLKNRFRVHYAMKANRFSPLLTFLKMSGQVAIDACSPNEVRHAMSCGFFPNEISLTATNLSEYDFAQLSPIEGLKINLDSISAIRRWGAIKPSSTIGIRINPAAGVSRSGNDMLQYCGNETTKFGVYREQFKLALDACAEFGLTVDTIHFHTGCGYLTEQLASWDRIIQSCLWFVDQVESIKRVNVGGGLGVPHTNSESALDLDLWASILAKHFLRRSINVEVEPGDFLVKDAGILLLQINTVEQRRSERFVGVDAGFNVAPEPAVYSLPFEPVMLTPRMGPKQTVTIAGNINEALDVFYRDISMPPIQEGDRMALLNSGAYSSSMASNHCMRGEFNERILF